MSLWGGIRRIFSFYRVGKAAPEKKQIGQKTVTFEVYRVNVLDQGSVILVDQMGDLLSVVNAARASYAQQSETMAEKDVALLRYLLDHKHTSPFRHVLFTFEVRAPLMVARQWWRYVVGSDHTMDAWNEQSRRYTKSDGLDFYLPSKIRMQSKSSKQGSSNEVMDAQTQEDIKDLIRASHEQQYLLYKILLEQGVAGELARIVLPADAQYTTWRWTCSLQSLLHFVEERTDDHAQWEIRQYADACCVLVVDMMRVLDTGA